MSLPMVSEASIPLEAVQWEDDVVPSRALAASEDCALTLVKARGQMAERGQGTEDGGRDQTEQGHLLRYFCLRISKDRMLKAIPT